MDHLMNAIDQYKIKVHAALTIGPVNSRRSPRFLFNGVESTFRFLEVTRKKNLRVVCQHPPLWPTDDLQSVKEDDRLNPVGIYPCWKPCVILCAKIIILYFNGLGRYTTFLGVDPRGRPDLLSSSG
jgi:hypothetical protein